MPWLNIPQHVCVAAIANSLAIYTALWFVWNAITTARYSQPLDMWRGAFRGHRWRAIRIQPRIVTNTFDAFEYCYFSLRPRADIIVIGEHTGNVCGCVVGILTNNSYFKLFRSAENVSINLCKFMWFMSIKWWNELRKMSCFSQLAASESPDKEWQTGRRLYLSLSLFARTLDYG